MELKFILGKSGKARTEYCIEEMLKAPLDKKIIYIVPEQFTLESEKALVSNSKRKSLLNIDVMSFRRLYFHITGQVGRPKGEFLDDEGRNMILRRLIEELKPEFFSRSQNKPGFLDSLESIISEFYRFKLTPEVLKENIKKMKETSDNTDFIMKLSEIAEIYSAFRNFMGEKYISPDGILDFVAAKIKDTDLFDNCLVYIDGFNSFTAQEYAIISEIFAYSEKVAITLCLEKPVEISEDRPKGTADALTDSFYETKAAYVKLCRIFRELYPTGKNIRNETAASVKRVPRDLDFFEKNFFELTAPVYDGTTENIKVFSAVNKKAEVTAACDEICSLINEGMRCKEIGIILCDPSYASVLRSSLKAREIPDFSDSRVSLSSQPLSRVILSLINIAAYDFRSRDVFTFLKTGFTRIKPMQVQKLEKYALEYGIEGYRWRKELNDPCFEETRQLLIKMVSPLTEFNPQKTYSLSELNKALFKALKKSGFYAKYRIAIRDAGDETLASKYKQLWEQAVDTFNKAEEFLGSTNVTLEEYCGIISSGFAKKSAATIPMYQDNIIIGDITRSRLPEVKVLFVLGANKDNLPRKFEDTSLINDKERALMKAYGMEIAADTKEQLSLEYLKTYQILTKPSQRLYISYALGTNDGSALEKSEIADKAEKMFCIEPKIYEEEIITPEKNTPFNPDENVSPELMKRFLGNTLTLSSSKLEKYAVCPFSYYLNYILNLKEDKLFEISPIDRGNIMHAIMEKIFGKAENILNMTEEEISKCIEEIMPVAVAENLSSIVDESNKIPENFYKQKYFINKLEKTAVTSVIAAQKQLNRGKFVPADFEVYFGKDGNNTLPPVDISEGIKLTGKIDRVDLYEEGNDVYVKITDYKSSAQTLDKAETDNGLKLQLLLYLLAYTAEKKNAAGNKKNYRPAGLMYFSFSNPILNANNIIEGTKKTKEALIMENFLPVGFISEEAREAVDKVDKADIKNAAFNFTKKLKVKPEQEFIKLMEDAKNNSAKMGENIKSGIFPIGPYEYGKRTGCQLCPYDGICEIETDKSRFKVLEEKSDSDNIREK